MRQELPADAVLVIVDVQKGWDDPSWGRRNNPLAEHNIVRLLDKWRETRRPVVYCQHLSKEMHSPVHLDSDGCQIKEVVKPQSREPVFRKYASNGFIGTDLQEWLKRKGHRTLVIVGLTTMQCVFTTARMAGDLGYNTYVVADASAAFEVVGYDGQHYGPDQVHAIALANLNAHCATVVDTETLLGLFAGSVAFNGEVSA